MKKILLLLTLIFFSSFTFSQHVNAEKNYKKGLLALNVKEYEEAISFLTLSIEEQPSANAFFERAKAYYQTGDTCSFCNDLMSASYLGDSRSENYYLEKCRYVLSEQKIPDSIMMRYSGIEKFKIIKYKCLSDSLFYFVLKDDNDKSWEVKVTDADKEIYDQSKFELFLSSIESQPYFVGGNEEYIKYIEQNLQYPTLARDKGIQGHVLVNFIIETDGSVSNVNVLEGIGGGCDKEAVRVVSNMPNWKPGIQNGENISVSHSLSINFTLQRQSRQKEITDKNLQAGSEAMKNHNYPEAISCFTKSIEETPLSKTFYYRALAYSFLGDTCNFCTDLANASGLNNKTATRLFRNKCAPELVEESAPDSLQLILPEFSSFEIIDYNCNSYDNTLYDLRYSNQNRTIKISSAKHNNKLDSTENVTVAGVVDLMPEFPGGISALMNYLASNIQYPDLARDNKIQGRVILKFVVENDGSISNIKLVKGIGGGCDEEAVRVIMKMPKWIPGIENDKPIRVSYNMPIKFTLRQ